MDDHRSRGVLDLVLHEIADARHYNDWMFSLARPYLGRSVLDVGAGIGTFTERAAEAGAFGLSLWAVARRPRGLM